LTCNRTFWAHAKYVCIAACASPALALAAPPPILDMHLHALHAADQGPPPVAICAPYLTIPVRDPRWSEAEFANAFFKIPHCAAPIWSPLTDAALRNQTLKVLRARNIIAVASGPADVVATWAAEDPAHIIPALAFGVADLPTPETLRALHRAGQLKVIGEIAVQYDGVAPDDPRLEAIWAVAEELDVPVGIHMGTGPPGAPYLPGMSASRARFGDPLLLEEVLVRHPRLRIYVMHAGWPLADNMIALLWAHPQVYVDTGVIDYVMPRAEFHRYLRRLVDAGFEKRIMFGSDNMVWPGAIGPAIDGIQSAPFLSRTQKRDILYDNAARFLGLKTSAALAQPRPRRPRLG
jgi:predicted TIM-barrel fold metal-dependent hydrolase